jgi:hypothetical protein
MVGDMAIRHGSQEPARPVSDAGKTDLTDDDVRRAMVRGALFGTPAAFAVLAIALLGVAPWRQVALVALWPALVGGWFYGALVALAPAMRRCERRSTEAARDRRAPAPASLVARPVG